MYIDRGSSWVKVALRDWMESGSGKYVFAVSRKFYKAFQEETKGTSMILDFCAGVFQVLVETTNLTGFRICTYLFTY